MDGITPQPPVREIDGGDRVHIQQGDRSIPGFLGRAGTVVEVFRIPHDSCLIRIDGDPNHQREWFFYRDEVVISEA